MALRAPDGANNTDTERRCLVYTTSPKSDDSRQKYVPEAWHLNLHTRARSLPPTFTKKWLQTTDMVSK